ncbi:MAG: aminotransferase class I/II-fold pyridoxal phosphate-dependent enzyme [Saprospiraceae bacterium]|nr:aminotransferase class I/II-fold pyridoxal phosphate-dependent enzyme [Saprospiraceae bacterium]
MSNQKISLNSLCVKEYKDNRSTKPHQLPIYATSSFELETVEEGIEIFTGQKKGHVYGRYGNPTIDTVSQKLADMESFGTEYDAYGFLTSSGMSAISTIIYALLKSGDKVLTQGNLYGGTTELLTKVVANAGVETLFIDLTDLELTETTLKANPSVRLMYFETPANPTMACVDIAALCSIAQKYNVLTCIDNTFCTPVIQQPFRFGVDFIIHSTTKYLNGHGNSIAGVIIGHSSELKHKIWTTLKLMGSTCNPFDAWLINNGLKTLGLRIKQHSENAMNIAVFLENHPNVSKVNYNGLLSHEYYQVASRQMRMYGGMLSFEVKGGLQSALQFMNRLKFCTMAPTLGDTDTLVLHPATSSHLNVSKELRVINGISDGLIRVSVGIEECDDILNDINTALQNI